MARFHQHLRNLGFCVLACACASASSRLHAKALDTVIAPHLGMSYLNEERRSSINSTTNVQGYRYLLRADFMSLSSNVSINAISGFGGSYNDFGLQFRLFDFLPSESESSSGLYYGAGAGFSYSPGFDLENIEKIAFFDVLATAYLRYLWDTQNNWGVFAELAYEGVLLRSFKSDPTLEDKAASHRAVMSLGFPFEVDL